MYRKRLKGYASIGYKTIVKNQPTLFDNYADTDLSHREGQIFNGVTFFRPFQQDLASAHSSIVISSPKLYRVERNPLVSTLCEKMHEGISIKVLTASQDEQMQYLLSKGISVKVIPNLSVCTTIIDKSKVWYGGIHVLGFASEEDSAIKVTDLQLADELLEFLG